MLTPYKLMCCGWRELHNMHAYQGDFDAELRYLYADGFFSAYTGGARCGAALFTDIGGARSKKVTLFAKHVKERKLGKVVLLPVFTNPNTGRKLKSYVWLIDQPALQRYIKQHKIF